MHLRLLVSTGFIALATSLGAQELPDEPSLVDKLARSLPAWWTPSNLVVVATTQLGDAARPRALVRFEADASPSAPLYEETGSEGPFALVVQTRPADESRRLYGVFDLSYSAGAWTGDTTIENPVAGLGRPLDLFGRPTLDIAAADAEATLAALRSTAMAEASAALEREMAALRAQHAAALTELEIAHSSRLGGLRAAQASELSDLSERHAAALTEAERAHRTALADIVAEIAPQQAEAEAERERLLGEAATASAQALREAREAAERELNRLQEAHAEARAALIAFQAEELFGLETSHAEARSAVLARQAAELAELQASDAERARQLTEARQQTAEALRAAQDEGDAELEALRAAHAERRGELITRQRQELAELETGLATERASLQRRLEAATDVVALQEALKAALAVRYQTSSQILEAIEQSIAARRAVISGLPTNWVGEISCRERGGAERSWRNSFYMRITEFRSDGFGARIGTRPSDLTSYNYSLQFTYSGEDYSFPMGFRGIVNGRSMSWVEMWALDVQFEPDGKLSGEGGGSFTVNNVKVSALCVVSAAP
jgi:hypothetical protein